MSADPERCQNLLPLWGPFFRPQSGPAFGEHVFKQPPQARAVWQWWNYIETRAPEGKSILRVNMDETSVCLFQGGGKGTVFRGPPAAAPAQWANRSKRRRCLSHVAFICDRPELQPVMPQVLIGNCATLLRRDWAALLAGCPPNVFLVRQKSSWNNSALCARLVRLLAAALAPYAATVQPVLFMDAYRVHYHRLVLSACCAAGVWPVMIPAKMTWLLQPCDTHAFLAYKLRLRESYQRHRAESADGQIGVRDFLPCIYEAIRLVLQGRRWDHAFDADGLGQRQAAVSRSVQRWLQLEGAPAVPSAPPSEEQLRMCLPARARVDVAAFLRPLAPPRAVPAARRAVPVGVRFLGALPPRFAVAVPPGGALVRPRAAGALERAERAVPASRVGRLPRTRAEHRAAAASSGGGR